MNTIKRLIYRLRGFKPCEKCQSEGTVSAFNPVYGEERFRCDRCDGRGFRPHAEGETT